MRLEWIGFLFLLLLSVRDIREKKVNGIFILPAGVVGVFLILIRKGNRKTEIPYLPFLTFSYLIYLVSNF